eukprot:4338715-Alexandrium_andersonii.AAC.1
MIPALAAAWPALHRDRRPVPEAQRPHEQPGRSCPPPVLRSARGAPPAPRRATARPYLARQSWISANCLNPCRCSG